MDSNCGVVGYILPKLVKAKISLVQISHSVGFSLFRIFSLPIPHWFSMAVGA